VFLAADAPLHQVLFLMSATVLWSTPVAVLLLALTVHDPIPTHRVRSPLLAGVAALARDRVLLRFVAATLLIWTAEGVLNSLAVFSFSAGLQLPDKLFWIVLTLYVATLVAVPFTLRLAAGVEKHRLMAFGISIYAGSMALLIWAPEANFVPTAVIWIVAGLGYASITVLPTSVLADVVDHGDVASGERRAGAYAAIYYLVVKLGLALGVGLAFGLMQLVHYDPTSAVHGVADRLNIRLLGFGLPSLLYFAAMLLYLKHPITRKAQQELRRKLTSRPVINHA
jgi:GPH family glycoside/pentoside/hexuronide:cation symporter